MTRLPRAARLYLFALWGIAALLVSASLLRTSPRPDQLPLLALWLGLFVLADYFEVEIELRNGSRITTSICDAPSIFLVAIAGPAGVAVVLLGSAFVDTLLRRTDWYRSLFNAAVRSIVYFAMLLIYNALSTPGTVPFSGALGLAALLTIGACYFTLNTLLVATIVGLASGQPLLPLYRESLRSVGWVHFVTMPMGAVIAALWSVDPWLTIPGIIPLAMAQRSFRAVASWQEQSRRSSELAREAQQLAAELQQKQDELIRSSKLAALGTFSAGIGHEFNNLLAGIMGFAQIGRQSSSVDDKNEALDVAVRACLRGRSITGGLLTFARRDEAQRGIHLIQNIVDETLLLVERELAKLNIGIERRFTPVMPSVCDAGQISQVVLNLLTNARDAMAAAGGTITIALGQQGEWLELAVSDTGSGIPAELIDQVFQPFMTTKGALGGSTTPGTGLGLAICHGIVQSHGGTIAINSVVGHGTTVTVRLPLVRDDDEPATVIEQAAPAGPLRILVVDDDELVAQGIARLLDSNGHQASVASSGQQALRLFRQQPFELVLCDLVMPGMHGFELIRRLRALDGTLQVLAMTGQAAPGQVEQAREAGALAVLSKPFAIEELLAALAASALAIRVIYHTS